MRWEAYHIPQTVDEALQVLAHYKGQARVVGGGTDFFVDDRVASVPQALVDVTRLQDLRKISLQDSQIVIGCGVTHTQIAQSSLIRERASALAEACEQIGGPQVRNVATLAGNIAHALPAADGSLALLALGAEVCVASLEEAKAAAHYDWWPLEKAFQGPGLSTIDSTRQVLVAVRFSATGPHEASAFARVMRPQGVALPILALAIRLRLSEGTIDQARVAIGPVARTPYLAQQTANFMVNKQANEQTLEDACNVLMSECAPRTSPHRATVEYRRELIPVLLRQACETAIARCMPVVV